MLSGGSHNFHGWWLTQFLRTRADLCKKIWAYALYTSVRTQFACTHSICVYALYMRVRTLYECTHSICVYAFYMSVCTLCLRTHSICVYALHMSERTQFVCMHSICVYALYMSVYAFNQLQVLWDVWIYTYICVHKMPRTSGDGSHDSHIDSSHNSQTWKLTFGKNISVRTLSAARLLWTVWAITRLCRCLRQVTFVCVCVYVCLCVCVCACVCVCVTWLDGGIVMTHLCV